MKKISRSTLLSFLVLLTTLFSEKVSAQNPLTFLNTPVKTVNIKGEKYLQRDMTKYVLNVSSNINPAYKENDEELQWLKYLNRPHPAVETIEHYFQDAAKEFNVPVELLKVIGYVESNWTQRGPTIDLRWGIMGLGENNYCHTLKDAADLIKLPVQTLRDNAKQNIRGAAALISSYAKSSGKTYNSLEDWFDVLKKFTGHYTKEIREMAVETYYNKLNEGVNSRTLWEQKIIMPKRKVDISQKLIYKKYHQKNHKNTSSPKEDWYPGATADETANQSSRDGTTIDVWVNHWMGTGTFAGAISWFHNPDSWASAHFCVDVDGTLIQMVPISAKAWHATVFNKRSIGIEHYATIDHPDNWNDVRMLKKSAEVARHYCDLHNIPKERKIEVSVPGIYGHTDIPGVTKNCPGPLPWDKWLGYLNGEAPVLKSVLNSNGQKGISFSWDVSLTDNLTGFRLYYATSDNLDTWKLAADENTLTSGLRTFTINDPSSYVVPTSSDVYYYKMTAIYGTDESPESDVYSRSSYINGTSFPKVLIVDGFDRTSGSYSFDKHNFNTTYFKALRNYGNLLVSSCANDAVEDASINLNDFDVVVWFVGDESTVDETFNTTEQTAVKNYLENGGKLFVSGSEVAWDLDNKGSSADKSFYHDYLKSVYFADGGSGRSPATGVVGSDFEGTTVNFGQVYPEDYPDEITANGTASVVMKYANNNNCAVAYTGTFGAGTEPGCVLNVSYTVETSQTQSEIDLLMEKFLQYAGVSAADTEKPVTAISAGTTQSNDFTATYTDTDNLGVDSKFYSISDFDGSEWRANGSKGFFNDEFTGNIHSDYTQVEGTWSISANTLLQSDESKSNTNIYATLNQESGTVYMYKWKMKISGSGTNRRAGLHFFCDDPTMSSRNNSYFVYFRADNNKCQIYKVTNDTYSLETDDDCTVNADTWYNIKVIFDNQTGTIKAYLDDVLVSTWTDSSPFTSGNSISLRTGNCKTYYDDIQVFKSRSNSTLITVGAGKDARYEGSPACKIKSQVIDVSGNFSTAVTKDINITFPDTQAPTAPTNLAYSNVTETTANLSWDASTDNIGVTGYRIYKNGSYLLTTTDLQYSISGLTQGTNYNFYIKATDAVGNYSNQSNTINFTTLTANTSIYCESKGNNVSDEWLDRVVIGIIDNNSGANGGYSDFTSMSTSINKGNIVNFTLYPAWSGTIYDEAYAIWIDYNQDGDFDDAGELVYSHVKTKDNPVTGSFTVSNSALIGNTTMRVILRYSVVPSPCGTYDYGETEDYTVNIQGTNDTQSPTVPGSLNVSNITESSLLLSWNASTDNVGVEGYKIYQNGSYIATSTSTSYSVNGLVASTAYSFYVKSFDASDNLSSASNIVNATTLANSVTSYCDSKGNVVTDEWINRVVVGSIDNTSGANSGYINFTSQSANISKGVNETITIYPGWAGTVYNEGYAVWIDYNQDGDFEDAGEMVWSKAASKDSPVAGSFIIPVTAADGTTRMRVSMKYGGIPTACETFNYGEVEDYTVNIVNTVDTEAPSTPTGLAYNNLSETSLDLSWTASSDNVGVTGYDVYQNGAYIATVSGTSYSVSGLSGSTTYNFYVKAKDAAGNISSQSNTVYPTTLAGSLTYCESQGNNVSDEWIQRVVVGTIDNNSGENDGYGDFTSMTANMSVGSQYSVTIYPAWSGTTYDEGYAVWIDYNKDGSFDDIGELVFSNAASQSTSVNGTFTVPAATSGQTRMRVSMQWNAIPPSCGNLNYGEVEDYTVSIVNSKSYNLSNQSIYVYPNPADNEIYIKISDVENYSKATIYSVTGAIVKNANINKFDNKINVTELKSGVYLIKVESKDKILNTRFIKK